MIVPVAWYHAETNACQTDVIAPVAWYYGGTPACQTAGFPTAAFPSMALAAGFSKGSQLTPMV